VKYIAITIVIFLLIPHSGASAQGQGDPDSTELNLDSIRYRPDSLIHFGDPRITYSSDYNWNDTSVLGVLPSPEYYKNRYTDGDLLHKVVDNWGKGFDELYGTRNLRPILHGVAYRGGANNYYHTSKKRKNSNMSSTIIMTNSTFMKC
jgi:hypothetical protein